MARKSELLLDFNAALARLRDEKSPVSSAVLSALSGADKKELAAFAQAWIGLPVERRRRASQILVDLAKENFENDFSLLFRYLFNDEDAEVRAHAIDGLWEDEDSALVKPLVGFLRSDPDARVRAAAADALGRFVLLAEYGRLPQSPHAELVHDALLATVRSANEVLEVRHRAVEALAYWSDEIVRDVITGAYADEDAQMRASAVSAMGRNADAYWRKTAAGELESPDARMRFEAARAAGELEDRAAVPRLVELLDDPDREVQGAAITALGQIGGKVARQALTRAASSEDEVVRSLAGEALQELESSNSSDLLLFELDTDEALDAEERDETADDEFSAE